ncbi:hypothetical protein ACRQ5Q_22390 [Bradyrhizobium sp. PMVTL-01]|uniref:hypothetical protein n=1 Tax=Bradyrhizobium sp. PMVTL-01 TaxID=3434999 RepID=UPI003F71D3C3
MSLALVFRPEKLPRTMTRAQWRDSYRWLRKVRKELRRQAERDIEAAVMFGDARRLEHVINPPLLVIP